MLNIIWKQPDGTYAVTTPPPGDENLGYPIWGTADAQQEIFTPTEQTVTVDVPTPQILKDTNGKMILDADGAPQITMVNVPTEQTQTVQVSSFITVQVPAIVFEDSNTHAATLLSKDPNLAGWVVVAVDTDPAPYIAQNPAPVIAPPPAS